jgi:hypothetical protein
MFLLPKGTFAQSFEINWTGAYGSGSGNFSATSSGQPAGTFLLTSIIGGGTQGGDPISLQGVPGYGYNDNLIMPTSSPLLDYRGFSIVDGTTGYDFNIYSLGPGLYYECSSNSDDGCNPYPTNGIVLTSFTITETPEPSTILLFLSGFGVLLILAGRKVSS